MPGKENKSKIASAARQYLRLLLLSRILVELLKRGGSVKDLAELLEKAKKRKKKKELRLLVKTPKSQEKSQTEKQKSSGWLGEVDVLGKLS